MKVATPRWAVLAAATASICISVSGGAAQADTGEGERQAGNATHAADVVNEVRHADGTVTQTLVTPAPGVDAADLAARLTKERGTTYRVADDESLTAASSEGDVTASVAACSYGYARTWPTSTRCFARWTYQGHDRPRIHFRDYSSDAWPVSRAVARWNQVSGIDSIWRLSACPSNVHCVPVRSGNYGRTGWVGLTSRTLNSAGTYATSASIKLNNSYGGTLSQHWNTACHETGHVLGLGHNVSTGSCLYSSRTSQRYPTMHDENLLERYY